MVSNLDYDDYIGRICIGRIRSGGLKVGQTVGFQYGEEGELRTAPITKLWEFHNNQKREVQELSGGDIGAFAGMGDVVIGDTVVDPTNSTPLPPIYVEEPTVALQFGILIENMRREGFELMIGPPQVIMRKDPETNRTQEPYEEVVIEVPSEYQGVIMEEMSKKGAVMKSMESAAIESNMILTFDASTRGLIGLQGKFAQKTKGSTVM